MRLHPQVDATITSPNQSERGDSIQIGVWHDTESPQNKRGVAEYFSQDSTQASAHVVVDNSGTSIRCVADEKKAWHVANYNSVAWGIEQCGWSTDGRSQWLHRRKELYETARWIAEIRIKWGVPIAHGAASGGQVHKRGWVTHRSLGDIGGGHNDPAPSYPYNFVLQLARTFYHLRRGK